MQDWSFAQGSTPMYWFLSEYSSVLAFLMLPFAIPRFFTFSCFILEDKLTGHLGKLLLVLVGLA